MASSFSRRIAWLALACAVCIPGHAHDARAETESVCDPNISSWIERCSSAEGIKVASARCPPGAILLTLEAADASLVVEVARSPKHAFRQVHGLGLSPVGEFPDWNVVPAPVRGAFEALTRCADRDPTLDMPTGSLHPHADGEFHAEPSYSPPASAYPWRLVAAISAAIAATALGLRSRVHDRRTITRTAGMLAFASVATYVFRALSLPTAFFHQNGHGPMWVGYALCESSPYGPGFAQIFRAPARWATSPESGVFLAMGIACSLAPAMLWLLLRYSDAKPALAWASALVFALHPVVSRSARSESYYAIELTLLLTAAAVLAVSSHRLRIRSAPFALGVLSSGLFIAQAALIHPTAWIASALIPIVVLVRQGRLRRRLAATLLAASLVGVVVLISAGPGILASLHAAADTSFVGQTVRMFREALPSLAPALLLGAVAILLSPSRRRAWVSVAALLAVIEVERVVNLFGPMQDWAPPHAWLLLFLPAFAPAAVATIRGLVRSRRQLLAVTAAVLGAGLAHDVLRWRTLTELPTDALEAARAADWRRSLPPHAVVAYLERSGRRIATLPFYPLCGSSGRIVIDLPPPADGTVASAPPPILPFDHYVRSSLCSTAENRETCDAFERTHTLEPIDTTTLPARSSMPGLDYDRPQVDVGLYRVVRRDVTVRSF